MKRKGKWKGEKESGKERKGKWKGKENGNPGGGVRAMNFFFGLHPVRKKESDRKGNKQKNQGRGKGSCTHSKGGAPHPPVRTAILWRKHRIPSDLRS